MGQGSEIKTEEHLKPSSLLPKTNFRLNEAVYCRVKIPGFLYV